MRSPGELFRRLADRQRVWRARRRRGVQVGRGSRFGPGVTVSVDRGGSLVIGERVTLGAGCELVVTPGARISIGDDVFMGRFCVVAARMNISIGAGTMLAEMVSIRDHDHDPAFPPTDGQFLEAEVHIGQGVWLAAKSSVVRRGGVGDHSVVGAHSLVNRPMPGGSVVAGVPAKVMRRIGRSIP